MTALTEIVSRVGTLLDAVGVPFMVAGSVASSAHGLPRSTQDIDIVVELDRKAARRLIDSLPKDEWYADADAADDAVLRGSMFNLIDLKSGWKIDLVVRRERPFSRAEFARRKPTDLLGESILVATAEDTIIAKLEWSKASGGSERQRRDVRGIIDMQAENLDREHITKWVAALGLEAEWDAVNAGA